MNNIEICLEKFGYKASKSAIERHAALKKINKRLGSTYLVETMNLKIEKTSKNQIKKIRIIKADLKWVKNILKM